MKLLSLLLVSTIGTSNVAELRLQSLTVPADRLPHGCRLAPVPKSATGKPLFVGYPNLTENPWVGADVAKVRSIRGIVDGPPYWHGPGEWSKLSDDVIEAYRAIYRAADGAKTDVYAVRFTDPKFTNKASLRSLADGVPVIVRGTVVISLSGARRSVCFRAVTDYITSIEGLDRD